jgi:DNA polymerase-3 subunit delta'
MLVVVKNLEVEGFSVKIYMSKQINFDWPIVGHGKIKGFLQTLIKNQSLAHAFIFEGPSQVGKTLTAKLFANSILCDGFESTKEDKVSLPCHKCEACREFSKNMYPDFYVLEREINEKTGEKKNFITVPQIRILLEKISKRAFLNSYKIVLIPEAQYLNQEASNCLLKTLEEPAARTIIILITQNRDALLPTIQSRCQVLKFLPITKDEIYEYLLSQGANRSEAKELAGLAQGRPTVAMHYYFEREELLELKRENQNLLGLFESNATQRFKSVGALLEKNDTDDKAMALLQRLTLLVRDLILVNSYNQDFLTNIYLEDELQRVAKRYSLDKLKSIAEEIEKTGQYIRQNVSPRFALENLVLGF